jgi:hypothetical protein
MPQQSGPGLTPNVRDNLVRERNIDLLADGAAYMGIDADG